MKSPLRVVFMVTGLGRGGAERQLTRIVTHLDRARFEPLVISLMPPEAFTEELRADGVPFADLGMTRGRPGPGSILKAVRLIRRHQADVVVAFMVHSFLLARLLRPLTGVKVVSSIRTEQTERRPFELLTSLTDRLSYATVVNGSPVAEAVVARGAVSPDRVRVIFNAAAPAVPAEGADESRRKMRSMLGVDDDAFVWLSVARLVPEKDHRTLLSSFSLLRATHPDARLFLAGDGPLRGEVEEELERRGLRDHVTCLGTRTDVDELLGAADGFVLSSHVEGSPNALLEAMAAGLPSVASKVGGVTDLLCSEQEGRAVRPADAEALGAAMREIMDLSKAARRALGERGRARVQEAFAIPRIVTQWETLITEAYATR